MASRVQARDVLLSVDRARPATLGRQIEEQLREAIREGTLAMGSPLPSTRVLAEDLAVPRGVIVAGSTHPLSLISRALAQAGVEEIGLENPSHMYWRGVVERAGLRPVGIPVDRHGLVVDGIGATQLGVVMTAPAHQFPTGSALAGPRRTALLEWAVEN